MVCDLTKFNQYFKLMVENLGSREEMMKDLLSNLFKGYKACSNSAFIAYIEKKQDLYEEGEVSRLTS